MMVLPLILGILLENSLMLLTQQWIGRGGKVSWPPRSPDLTPLYYSPVESEVDLIGRILAAAAIIQEKSNLNMCANRCQHDLQCAIGLAVGTLSIKIVIKIVRPVDLVEFFCKTGFPALTFSLILC
jgi:hypothetical protein